MSFSGRFIFALIAKIVDFLCKSNQILKRVSLKFSILLSEFYSAHEPVQMWHLLNFNTSVFRPYKIQQHITEHLQRIFLNAV